jgi:hypothetical protein
MHQEEYEYRQGRNVSDKIDVLGVNRIEGTNCLQSRPAMPWGAYTDFKKWDSRRKVVMGGWTSGG